jgi:hypothetical protein
VARQARVVVLGEVPVKDLAQINAHWYESLFVALSVDPDNHVVEVHVMARQAQNLLNPHPSVKGGNCKRGDARFVTPDGLEVNYPPDVVRRKR